LAKRPARRPEPPAWADRVERPRGQIAFQVDGALPDARGQFDPAQLEQALVNLLHNAHESGSPPADVQLRVRKLPGGIAIEISDRGAGMTEAVLSNALLPFYSTKRGGTLSGQARRPGPGPRPGPRDRRGPRGPSRARQPARRGGQRDDHPAAVIPAAVAGPDPARCISCRRSFPTGNRGRRSARSDRPAAL